MAVEETNNAPGGGPPGLTDAQAAGMFAGMNEVIRAGEEARRLRAELIKVCAGLGWTQDRIARLTGLSQPAVSKQMAKERDAGPGPVMDLSLSQGDPPWLEGRLWGLAEELAEAYGPDARRTAGLRALTRGKNGFAPEDVDVLRRLVEEDLRRYAAADSAHRRAYDEISRGLDLPAAPPSVAPPGTPSVRRALAHRLQRDALGNAHTSPGH
ncbi:sigma-70 family RNA polymerase sigma factor [Streptomyces sp. NPDC057682]|uniref:sigma-70 family RNA polymerase sigma factor n=1 Tax=Streptomyces sp. NPDC057682 TaxID=3346210 RepID=UPI0036AA4EE2